MLASSVNLIKESKKENQLLKMQLRKESAAEDKSSNLFAVVKCQSTSDDYLIPQYS